MMLKIYLINREKFLGENIWIYQIDELYDLILNSEIDNHIMDSCIFSKYNYIGHIDHF